MRIGLPAIRRETPHNMPSSEPLFGLMTSRLRRWGHGKRRQAHKPPAGQNIGYYDNLMHKYWHFKDIGFSTDGTPLEDADPVNALTQIKVLTAGLAPSSGLPDDVRSYNLGWLLHLVGDAISPCMRLPDLHTACRMATKAATRRWSCLLRERRSRSTPIGIACSEVTPRLKAAPSSSARPQRMPCG
jgi:hypothetical protein